MPIKKTVTENVEPVTVAKPAPKPRVKRIGKNEQVKTMAETAGLMSTGDKRNEIRVVIEHTNPPPQPSAPIKPPRAKRILTEDQKAVLRERLTRAREAKVAKKLVAVN